MSIQLREGSKFEDGNCTGVVRKIIEDKAYCFMKCEETREIDKGSITEHEEIIVRKKEMIDIQTVDGNIIGKVDDIEEWFFHQDADVEIPDEVGTVEPPSDNRRRF